VLQGGLDVIELVRGHEGLRVAAKEPAQEILAGPSDPHPDVADGGLEGLVVAEPVVPEARLDGRVEVMRQVLGDATSPVAPDACHPQQILLADARRRQHAEGLEHGDVLLADGLVPRGPTESEGNVDALQRLDGQTDLGAHLGVRPRRGGMAPAGGLEVAERQVARRKCPPQIVGLDAHRAQVGDHPRAHHVAAEIRACIIRRDDAEGGQLSHPLDGGSAAAGKVGLRQAIARRLRIGDECLAAGLGAEPVARSIVLRRRHRVVRIDPHPADRIGHHRHPAVLAFAPDKHRDDLRQTENRPVGRRVVGNHHVLHSGGPRPATARLGTAHASPARGSPGRRKRARGRCGRHAARTG